MWIFISHSTLKGDEDGLARLRTLRAALELQEAASTGHDVLLDFERLDPSVKWRSQIDEWLAQCHAAVLMLTPKSLASPWVLKEATILAHRVARDADFRLFPVLLDGLKREDLIAKGGHFAPLYLDAIQRVGATDADGIAVAVIKELAKLAQAPVTPLDALRNRIASLIESGKSAELERICIRITGKPVQWSAEESRSQRCASEIARGIVRRDLGGYKTTGALIQDLFGTPLTKENAGRALNLTAPLWVEGRAATPIADFAKRNLDADPKAGGWAVALNGEQVRKFTSSMYLRRAYLPEQPPILCTLQGGQSEHGAEELIRSIREEVRSADLQMDGEPDESVDRYLAALEEPFFIVLPPPVPDGGTLQTLQGKYPKVTFIAHTGMSMIPPEELPGRVIPLDPPVDVEREIQEHQDFTLTRKKINDA